MRVLEEVGTVNYPRDSNEKRRRRHENTRIQKIEYSEKNDAANRDNRIGNGRASFCLRRLTKNGFGNEIETKHYGQKDE